MLIEKAWAKLHGSYCMTRKGSTLATLPHMTGTPSVRFDHNHLEDLEAFWKTIKDADSRNYVVTGSTYETCLNQGGPEMRRMGIVSGHSYSLLSTHAFKHAGQQVKLLKLRNPHGNGEWEGDWSDASDKWTPKLRQQLRHQHEAEKISDGNDSAVPIEQCYEYVTNYIFFIFKCLALCFSKLSLICSFFC